MSTNEFLAIIKRSFPQPLYVLDVAIPQSGYIPINLSKYDKAFQSVNVSTEPPFSSYICNYLKQHKAKVAYGGYLEERNIYQRSQHFNKQSAEERNIHLGLDLWCKAGTKVFAPLNGVIHSFKNNTNYGDYGPTIILEHKVYNEAFYTLYGHLSLASIEGLQVGQPIKQNKPLAVLGNATENGDYPPHLHFQVIRDMQGYFGDYPGVCAKKDLGFYKENCPDPLKFLNFGCV